MSEEVSEPRQIRQHWKRGERGSINVELRSSNYDVANFTSGKFCLKRYYHEYIYTMDTSQVLPRDPQYVYTQDNSPSHHIDFPNLKLFEYLI